jgi:two-component system phosphate regulon response regulator PhoB
VDGFEACRWLKARSETQSIPIVFVTGLDEASARGPALAAGAEEFLAKPTHAQALIDRVQAALRSGLTPSPSSDTGSVPTPSDPR